METTKKDLEYYRKNAEEDYTTTPISVLRYITEMEQALRIHDVVERSEQLKALLENRNWKHYNNFSAPTQSLLQKWLREKHNLHTEVYYVKLPFQNPKYRVCVVMEGGGISDGYELEEEFKTYEEALEQAITQTLNLIP